MTSRVSWVRRTLREADLNRTHPYKPARSVPCTPGTARAREVDWALQFPAIYAAIHAIVFAYLALPEKNPSPYCTRLEFLFSVMTPCAPDNLALAFQVWLILALGFAFLSFAYKGRMIPRIVWRAEVKRRPPALGSRPVRGRYYVVGAGLWILILAFVVVVGREVPIPYVGALIYLLGAILLPTLLFCTKGANLNPVLGLLLAAAATMAFLTKIPMMIFVLATLNKIFTIRRLFLVVTIVVFALYAIAYFSAYRSFTTNIGADGVLRVLSSLEVDLLFVFGRLLARISLVDASVFISELINSGYLQAGTRPQEAIQLVNNYFDIGREVEVVFGYAIGLPMTMYVWLGVTGVLLVPVMIRAVDLAVVAVFQELNDTRGLFTLRLIYFLLFMQDSLGITFQLLITQLIGFALVKRIISRRRAAREPALPR